jgi:hypothetical protein
MPTERARPAMVQVLQLGRTHGAAPLRAAVEAAVALGCHDAAAVRHLLETRELAQQCERPAALAPPDIGGLGRYDRPLPEVAAYDQLLSPVSAVPLLAAAPAAGGGQ